MCGIFGYVGTRHDAAAVVLNGIRQLDYRGYDSWGVAVAADGRARVEKYVGKIDRSETNLPGSSIGVGHTRWATHGGVTAANAHPHADCSERLAVIHNGIVTNYVELKRALALRGHRFCSETDTELIAHLVEEELAREHESPEGLVRATMSAFRMLRGLNAFAVLDAGTNRIATAKNGSPLSLGFADSGHFFASDPVALLDHTRRVAFVRDGEAALLGPDEARTFDMETGRESAPEISVIGWTRGAADRASFRDFMTKEIHEQPDLLRNIAESSRDAASELAFAIESADPVFAIGCGSAWHAVLAAEYLFATGGHRVTAIPASEFSMRLGFVQHGSLVLALSQSGETIDVLDAVRGARTRGGRIAAMTNVEGSSLFRFADLVVPLCAGPERSVLATKSLVAKLGILILVAGALSGKIGEAAESIRRAADDVSSILHGDRRNALRSIAHAIHEREHVYVLGRGASYPMSLEMALKIKEVSYIHAEGFAAGELKHGVIALIERGTPCIVLAPNDDGLADVLSAATQVKARGAVVIGVGPEPHEAFDHHVPIADLGGATSIVNAVVAQLLGYDLARLRGCDPDRPRNLAKSVTVK